MTGSRFMVFKFKDILKTVVFAVMGIVIILGAVYFIFSVGEGKRQVYNPGKYSSNIVLENGTVTVEVKVGKTKIKSVRLINSTDDVPVFYPLFEKTAQDVEKHIKKEQELSFVPDKYTSVTGRLIIDAVEKSLAQARR